VLTLPPQSWASARKACQCQGEGWDLPVFESYAEQVRLHPLLACTRALQHAPACLPRARVWQSSTPAVALWPILTLPACLPSLQFEVENRLMRNMPIKSYWLGYFIPPNVTNPGLPWDQFGELAVAGCCC
jgi:hypothetical protein